jgi:hypothetical protein
VVQVNKAVIAVPAKFSPEQRQATAEAYKRAGLKVRCAPYCCCDHLLLLPQRARLSAWHYEFYAQKHVW